MLIVSDGIKCDSGHSSLDGQILFESGVFLEHKKPNGEMVAIECIRVYFVEEDELEIRKQAKATLQEIANTINKLITHLRNGNPENKSEFTVINNIRLELNDQSVIDETWVVANFRDLHLEAHRIGLSTI